MQINFSEYEKKDLTKGVELPNEVYQWLAQSKKKRIEENKEYSFRFKKNFISRSDKQIKSSHTMIKHQNSWLLIGNLAGAGGFGKVNKVKMEIALEGNKAILRPRNMVIKLQTPTKSGPGGKKNHLHSVQDEAILQRKHDNNVDCIFVAGNGDTLTLMENKGLSLDSLLPLDPDKYSFEDLIAISFGISNEMLRLEQTNTVHRDIKPSNFCIKKENGLFVISLIDFGLAADVEDSEKNKECSGTPFYMAPELLHRQTTPASDRWAFGPVLGELLNATDVFRNRKLARSTKEILKSTYCYDSLFDGIKIPDNVDEQIVADFKLILEQLQSFKPDERPSISFINKFIVLLPYRKLAYQAFKQEWIELEQKFSTLRLSYNDIGISNLPLLNGFDNHQLQPPQLLSSPNKFMVDKLEKEVLTKLRSITKPPVTIA